MGGLLGLGFSLSNELLGLSTFLGDSTGARLWLPLLVWPPPHFLEADSCGLLRSGLLLLFLTTCAGSSSFCLSLSFDFLHLQFSHGELSPTRSIRLSLH